MAASSYTLRHLQDPSETIYTRPRLLINPRPSSRPTQQEAELDPAIETFHRTLPHYAETPLHSLPTIAAQLGVAHVFLKDESTRFGLPAFKILGASWAIHRAVCRALDLDASSVSLDELRWELSRQRRAGARRELRLVTCTEGNWGRATARMAKYLDIPATIYIPAFLDEATRELLRGEGAEIVVLDEHATYDDCVAAVKRHAQGDDRALMVMDTAWEGYEEVPLWVTQGYTSMLTETTRQLSASTGSTAMKATHVFASVGVGSWAHAVTVFYTSASAPDTQVVTVEPTTAASFKESLHHGRTLTPIGTGDTIMNGMNCGTTSALAWPVLRDAVAVAATVTDCEAHAAVLELRKAGVNAGPCGAATLAALRVVVAEGYGGLGKGSVVVLFSTEGGREYQPSSSQMSRSRSWSDERS